MYRFLFAKKGELDALQGVNFLPSCDILKLGSGHIKLQLGKNPNF